MAIQQQLDVDPDDSPLPGGHVGPDGTAGGWDTSGRSTLRFLPGVVVAAVAVGVLVAADVAPGEVARYAAYWVLGVIVPGWIVHRVLRGRPTSLLEDLALGAGTGVALEVLAGLGLMALNLDRLAAWWSVPIYAAVAASPRLRRVAGPGGWSVRETPGQAWAMAGTAGVVLLELLPSFQRFGLPPGASTVNIDQWWHLGIVQELLKPGAPVDPRVAGEPFVYHWFSHLHLAIASDASGVAASTVMLRLWIVPAVLAILGLVVVLGRRASGITWAGPLAAAITFLVVRGGMLWTGSVVGGGPVSTSPSQTMSTVVVAAAAVGFVEASRRPLAWTNSLWLLVITLSCVGMKPSAIPVLLSGTLLALAARSVVRRRPDPWLLGLAAALLGIMVFIMPIVSRAASAATAKITLLGSLESMAPYSQLVGDGPPLGLSPGFLLDTLDSRRALVVAVATILLAAGVQAVRVVGLGVLVHPDTRRDPAGWWLAGAFLSGWGAVALLDHASRSQFYFLGTVCLFGSVLAAWLATLLLPEGARGRRIAAAVAGAGVLVGWVGRNVARWLAEGRPDVLDRIWMPMVVGALAVGTAALVPIVARRRASWAAELPGSTVLVVAVLSGLAVPGTVDLARTAVVDAATVGDTPVDQDSIDYLLAGEQEAALWLADNSQPEDVVATNAFCRPKQGIAIGCDTRGYWISGLSGRRVLLEGWAYTPQSHRQHGVGGRAYSHQSPPWPERFAVSQAAVAEPTPDVLDELRAMGVTWVFGVRGAGPVATDVLDELAVPAFDNGDVGIWRLDPPR